MRFFRVAAVCSSLALLFGCVWFTQKQANPTMMPSSKLLVLPQANQTTPQTVMPGSKSGTLIIPVQQPSSPAKPIMPSSKSFTTAQMFSAGALQTGTPQTPAAKP